MTHDDCPELHFVDEELRAVGRRIERPAARLYRIPRGTVVLANAVSGIGMCHSTIDIRFADNGSEKTTKVYGITQRRSSGVMLFCQNGSFPSWILDPS